MKIQIICRGLTTEGLGHLSRSRTFAEAASIDHDVEIVAILPKDIEQVFSDTSCSVKFARVDDEVTPYIQDFKPDVLLFDLLSIRRDLCTSLTSMATLSGSLSPIFDQMDAVDVAFSRSKPEKGIPGTKIFSGLEYAVFGHHCSIVDDAQYEAVIARPYLSIGVSMGGTDAANKTELVLRALAHMEDKCLIWVLLGEGYAHSYNALVDAVSHETRHEIVLAKTNRAMWHIMGQCAVSVLAGGLTTVESIYAGIPSINLSERPEHSILMQELFNMDVCLDGGVFEEQSLCSMVDRLTVMNRDRNELLKIRDKTKGLLDMDGAARILRELSKELAGKQRIRSNGSVRDV